mmetsp:Transcript_5709/g.5535  ORF Transcript_5709/g.5535 Transcript_5709/m.5535 type:complete len:83 (-) Transcript_5709:121-369(-)
MIESTKILFSAFHTRQRKIEKWRRVNPSVVRKKSGVWSNTASEMIEPTKVQEKAMHQHRPMIVVVAVPQRSKISGQQKKMTR